MESSEIYFRGAPTEIDVRKLLDALPSIQIGDQITHEQVQQITGLRYGSNRYTTVTNAWRKLLLEKHDIELGSVPGAGFKSLDAGERIDRNIDGMHHGLRKTVRSAKRVGVVSTDDPVQAHRRDTAVRSAAVIGFEHKRLRSDLKLPPPAQNPRPLPTST